MLAEAQKEIGEPYAGPLSDFANSSRFDGPGPNDGWDCSSFVAGMYKRALGITLTAYTDAAYDQLDPIAPSDALPGDVVFWSYEDGSQRATRFPHMGLVYSADRRRVLDCRYPGGVAINPTLNHPAVYRRARGISPR